MYFLLCFSVTQCISRFEGNLEDVDLVLASANTKKATMQKKTLMKAESNSAALLQCASKHSYFFFFFTVIVHLPPRGLTPGQCLLQTNNFQVEFGTVETTDGSLLQLFLLFLSLIIMLTIL